MSVYLIDPLQDVRWDEFVSRHPRASIFHTSGWLKALCRTYGYQAGAFTTTPCGSSLRNSLVFCRIHSWLTGTRIVSLPFSDHCEPLVESQEDLHQLCGHAKNYCSKNGLKYVEVRPVTTDGIENIFIKGEHFYLHQLDISEPAATLFKRFHRTCIQQKIRRAEREGVVYDVGRSEQQLRQFYSLMSLTRIRKHVPPQPFQWFENLANCCGNALSIHLAFKGSIPIAGLLTLDCRNTSVFKYSAADATFNNLGGPALLYWRAIQEAQENGMSIVDMGRADPADQGLVSFKEHWGVSRRELQYFRYPESAGGANRAWTKSMAHQALAWAPSKVLTVAGQLFYKHAG